MATRFERAFEKMTPAQRKKATAAVSGMMGMPTKKRTTAAKPKTATKK